MRISVSLLVSTLWTLLPIGLEIWPRSAIAQTVQVAPNVETVGVPTGGDPDDPAIWIHPTDRSQSTIIGTDKKHGLVVYDLDGKLLQFRADGEMNNVDLRYGFPLAGQFITLVTAGNRTTDSIATYRANPTTRHLEYVAARTIVAGITVYGSCMYHSAATGSFYVYISSKGGKLEQWALFDNDSGKVDGALVRTFDTRSQTEGCVADDELGYLYVAVEDEGIWKYGAEPGDGAARTRVDITSSGGHLRADVEGLTLYYANGGSGYLIASSQRSSTYVVYEREMSNDYVMTFRIIAGNGIDEVTHADGIDVVNLPAGPTFPFGIFVTHDSKNDYGNRNYKLVPWQDVANAVTPPLKIDTTWHFAVSEPRN